MRQVALVGEVPSTITRALLLLLAASCGRTGVGAPIDGSVGVDARTTRRDAGSPPSVVRFPDGGCPGPRFAPREALARSPRTNRLAEFAIIESGDQFVADDATYVRAAADFQVLQTVDAGKARLSFLPAFASELFLRFASDAGLVADGGYTDWTCLNEAYGGHPKVAVLNSGETWASIEFRPVIDAVALAADYERLPGIQSAQAQRSFDATSCCTSSDLCLDLGAGGQFTWLAQLNDECCAVTVWLRLRSQADGGREVERADTPPFEWIESAPRCAKRLSSSRWRYPDGGVVEFDAGR